MPEAGVSPTAPVPTVDFGALFESVQRHDVPRPPSAGGGGFEARYWSPCNSPVLGPDGRVCLIIHQVEDVTEYVRLQEQGSQARRSSTELRRRTEQMQAEILRRSQELHEKNLALRAAGEAKDEFLSRCSHELRTPLNAILGFSELLSLGETDAEHHAWASMIFKAGRHLLALLDDVLDISRIEGRQLYLSIEPVTLGPLLTDALEPGEQLLARLQADPATRDIPVMVLSADATQNHVDRLLAAGVTDYLTKPIAVLDLIRVVDRLFGGPEQDDRVPAGGRPSAESAVR